MGYYIVVSRRKEVVIMANELQNRFNDLMRGSDDFFGNLGRSFFNNMDDNVANMKTDVVETDKDYQVSIDLPGIDKKDINIDFKDNVLTVSAKRDSFNDEADKEGNLIASERSYGRFTRQYQFPSVDRAKISAKYDDGVLKITLPKTSDEIANNRHIEIQ